jgi:hypothetical protein
MKTCHFAARAVNKTIIAAGAALLTLAAACSSPTSPVAANAGVSPLHSTSTPVTHAACDGVGAGSSQC